MICQELIQVHQTFQTQDEVFDYLARLVTQEGYATDVKQVVEALCEREAQSTTGMMDGYAIPHAKSPAILKPAIVVLTLEEGIDWHSLDGQATRYILALFIPETEAGSTHLTLLSQLARLLMRREFKHQFEAAKTSQDLKNLLETFLGV
ncbi:PTS fructose transporter subunit IIA [Streptococcus sp. zg-86]|uniref:PTS fructose transporter subunit IIA n=1 Tax=Streptococcus zhangguiae TaxID=2664091 RepID=A0A6I4RMV4_9STRE|nr:MULTISPECIES: fructose PTS transporter subunit IIA [unclassified Streptococcus]MTB63577.1 PTS fructose transporter subunit IIA [Streptococcus sp. zg-86]MTB89774.1 PTS fructose transporter subunit IIA [Streptococcus sp. zg-36]MWV55445.1 PTS fructose transporter subunit IIA [Streptococcus sp. zg-70]QTH47638.1 PTS sugar transporter subunit IIA [Streptococcus sp. zg-86]